MVKQVEQVRGVKTEGEFVRNRGGLEELSERGRCRKDQKDGG